MRRLVGAHPQGRELVVHRGSGRVHSSNASVVDLDAPLHGHGQSTAYQALTLRVIHDEMRRALRGRRAARPSALLERRLAEL